MKKKPASFKPLLFTALVTAIIATPVALFLMNSESEEETKIPTIITGRIDNIVCNPNSDPCTGIFVRTEIDPTVPRTEDRLEGKFYIRAYSEDGKLLAEKQLALDHNPWSGDGGGSPRTPEDTRTVGVAKDGAFFLEYMDRATGWPDGGYFVRLETTEPSFVSGRLVDFYTSNGEFRITFPQ